MKLYSRQAITTHYLPATNYRPSRIVASCPAGKITSSYPMDYDGQEDAHWQVAKELIVKLGWVAPDYPATWVCGYCDRIPEGFVFTNVTSESCTSTINN